MAHTPGPWREGQDGNLRVYGQDNRGEDSGLIAIVFKGRANVRLIEAAPDLLAALRFVLAFYEPGQTHLDTEAWKTAERAARSAVAKAEGRPSPSGPTQK